MRTVARSGGRCGRAAAGGESWAPLLASVLAGASATAAWGLVDATRARAQDAAPAPSTLEPGDHELTILDEGRERDALIHMPPAAREGRPLPVVLVFHGGGGAPEGMVRIARLDPLADREGFIAVYPAGTGVFRARLLTWNAGGCCGYAREHGVDDVGFVVRLLKALAGRTPVDPTRVYATGLSNGAMMAYRLAAEAPERIAAIAPVAGAMMLDSPALATLPVPVLHIHSVDDPRALYEGGLGPPFPFTNHRVEHRPVQAGIDYWVRRNGCPAEARRDPPVRGREGTPSADHTAERIAWGPGRGGAEVVLWKLTGAGHVWPGGEGYARERIQGEQSDVVDAGEVLWGFFERFSRPEAPPLR